MVGVFPQAAAPIRTVPAVHDSTETVPEKLMFWLYVMTIVSPASIVPTVWPAALLRETAVGRKSRRAVNVATSDVQLPDVLAPADVENTSKHHQCESCVPVRSAVVA